jgi:hypothetical protein
MANDVLASSAVCVIVGVILNAADHKASWRKAKKCKIFAVMPLTHVEGLWRNTRFGRFVVD